MWLWLWIGLFFLTVPNVDSILEPWLDKKSCSGSENGWNQVKHSGTNIEHLKTLYDECKIVMGNLEISRISQEELDIAGGEHALDFLSSIEQVHGYVLIALNQIRTISLPNLQIIWGDDYLAPKIDNTNTSVVQIEGQYGLFVMDNPNLEVLDLRSLRAVHKESIGLSLNPYICHWQSIDYQQILGENYQNRIKIVSNFNLCEEKNKPVSCWSGCKNCFGPLKSQCQQIYRDNCADQCPKQMCYNSSSLLTKFCCHAECAAGCKGPGDEECYGCDKLQNGKKCVDRCPPPELYNSRKMEMERMPDGKYVYMRLCVDRCPAHTVTYRDACLSRCPNGYYINDARVCQECSGSCPKTCHISQAITDLNIGLFENCTDVQGFIHIGRLSFESGKHYPTNEKPLDYKGITMDDLEMLSNVRSVSDYVLIESGPYLTNLNFLRNLQRIEGRRPFKDKVSFQINGNDNLDYFGLINLKQIMNGEGWIMANYDLCYVYDIPWNTDIAKPPSFVKYDTNRDPKLCNESKQICDSSCESSKGCWGPGPHMCYECKDWKLNNKTCVENCTVEAGFYESAPKVCSSCHHECLMCNGSTSFNCLRCRNASLNGECVPFCPADDYYFNQTSKTCEKCHENCYQLGCTGPGNFVGNGGCKKCRYGIYDELKKTVSPCLLAISSHDHCSNQENYTNYFWAPPGDKYIKLVEHSVCVKCSNVCKRCSSYGNSLKDHGCICSSHRILSRDSSDNAICDMKCPENYYSHVSAMDPEVKDCLPCDPECEGCNGPSSSDCISCKHFRIELDKANLFNCTQFCPEELKHADMNKNCVDFDTVKYNKDEQRKINIIIVIVMATIFLALIAVCIVAFLLRRRTMMLTKLNIPEEHYEMNLEAKPDLSQLRLITELELKRGGVLGYGAFGTVFKGIWTAQDSQKVKLPVAIKVLHETKGSAQQDMLEEASHMARVNHPYLLKLIGVCLGQQMMLITPLMPLGNLLDYVQQNRAKIGSTALLRWCSQIASGMAHLEELRLVHRDLAARNVLVQNPYRIRITDFGLAKMLDYGEQELKIVEGKMPIKWLALECIQYRRYTHKSDVWAYGVTVWELLTFGDKPYKDVQLMQIPNLLEKGERLPQPKICTLDVYMILIKCWMVDADSRPSFKELHETFNKMLKDPGRYLVIEGDKLLRLPSYSTQDQRDMMRELIDDPDVVDLDEYLEDLTLPSSPSSPVTPNKPLLSEVEVLPRNGQRLQSTTSHRYASDPLKNKSKKLKNKNTLTMDLDNYLVPDSQSGPPTTSNSPSFPTVTYTPVVTGGQIPDCIKWEDFRQISHSGKHTYYNDLPMANGRTTTVKDSSDAQNFEYLLPNSVSLKKRRLNYDKSDEIIQNETVL